MAAPDMSSKDLLDKLYRGLDTVPAVEAEMDARELRTLADEQVAEMLAPDRKAAPAQLASDAPASRTKLVRSPLVILCGIAVAGTIAAAALRESDTRPAPPPAVVPEPPPPPPPLMEVAEVIPVLPKDVVLRNPFDRTEVFKFPPGTSKEEARRQMATQLLERARERGMRR